MPVSLRTTLTTATLTIPALTLALVLGSTFRQWRVTTEELSDQVIARTSQVIERRMGRLLSTARSASRLAQSATARHEAEGLGYEDFAAIGQDFAAIGAALPEFSYLTLGVARDGAYCQLQHRDDGTLRIQHCTPPHPDGRTRRIEWDWTEAGKLIQVADDPRWRYDPRLRPYFRAAQQAGKATWTDTYTFVDPKRGDITGVTFATPRYDAQKRLRCVVSVDFTLEDITRFLRSVRLGETGFGFVVEESARGPRVIASGSDSPAVLQEALRRIGRASPEQALQTATLHVRGANYRVSWRRIGEQEAPHWLICTLTPEKELLGRVENNLQTTLWWVALGGLLGIVCSVVLSSVIVGRLKRISQEMDQIRRLQLTPRPGLGGGRLVNISEVLQLGEGLERLKASLRSFERFVPTEYVRTLVISGKEAEPGGVRTELTVFFADLAGFTRLAESHAPEEAVAILSEFLELVSREVTLSGGVVDKYNGDEVMAFFHGEGHAERASRAALRAQEAMGALRARLQSEPLAMRIGLHSGEAILGVVGSVARYNYTVLGDTVNTAKRLEGQNKVYRTRIMLSDATRRHLSEDFLLRPLDFLAVVGKTEALRVYELMARCDEATAEQRTLAGLTTEALQAYHDRQFPRALSLFTQIQERFPTDGLATVLRSRTETFLHMPPLESWDGVWYATEK